MHAGLAYFGAWYAVLVAGDRNDFALASLCALKASHLEDVRVVDLAHLPHTYA
jgi:hypothetical protein